MLDVTLHLPLPISVNQFIGKRYKPKNVKIFRDEVWALCKQNRWDFKLAQKLEVGVLIFPRKGYPNFDADNFNKSLLDSLERAKVFLNDRQVFRLINEKMDFNLEHPDGCVFVRIKEYVKCQIR